MFCASPEDVAAMVSFTDAYAAAARDAFAMESTACCAAATAWRVSLACAEPCASKPATRGMLVVVSGGSNSPAVSSRAAEAVNRAASKTARVDDCAAAAVAPRAPCCLCPGRSNATLGKGSSLFSLFRLVSSVRFSTTFSPSSLSSPFILCRSRSGVRALLAFLTTFCVSTKLFSFFAPKKRKSASFPASLRRRWNAAAAAAFSVSAATRLASIAFRAETARGVISGTAYAVLDFDETEAREATSRVSSLSDSVSSIARTSNGSRVSWNRTSLSRFGDLCGGEGSVPGRLLSCDKRCGDRSDDRDGESVLMGDKADLIGDARADDASLSGSAVSLKNKPSPSDARNDSTLTRKSVASRKLVWRWSCLVELRDELREVTTGNNCPTLERVDVGRETRAGDD
mmetsp:Transcript_4938/g.18348  ORF Transcript_4938/g.18348 Transcript_4938/m.18348 type:complete len:400 (+) Transcript_4938:4461-5660(+)